jgi:hypothetical protein
MIRGHQNCAAEHLANKALSLGGVATGAITRGQGFDAAAFRTRQMRDIARSKSAEWMK